MLRNWGPKCFWETKTSGHPPESSPRHWRNTQAWGIISLRGIWLPANCPLPGERFDPLRDVSDPDPQPFHCKLVGRQADSKSGSELDQNMSSKRVPKRGANRSQKCPSEVPQKLVGAVCPLIWKSVCPLPGKPVPANVPANRAR